MPFIIQQLVPETQNLVTVTEGDSAQHALSLMIEHDFSQLPVTDNNQKLKGMITSDSLLRVVSHLKIIPEKLKVSHATEKAIAYREEDELFELLKGLRDISAVPIVDKVRRVTAIITSYDTAEYFRKRAEDIMLAEDIEVTLRDLIESSHKDENGDVEEDALAQAIQSITPSNKDHKNKFKGALLSYISQTSGSNPSLDSQLLDKVFKKHLEQPTEPKSFEELTLNDFIHMFKNLWSVHSPDFRDLEWDSMNYLLDDVRKTRNAIAHFREVKPEQREKLKFCADFLDRHKPDAAIETFSAAHNNVNNITIGGSFHINSGGSGETATQNAKNVQINSQLEEETDANDSRYAPLAIWLQTQESDRITCTFQDVEELIQDELPPSARRHRNWWANDSVSHTQSIQWLEVGWRVSSVNISAERVVFSRMGDRRIAYIEFFNQLHAQIQLLPFLSIQAQNPQGRSWSGMAVSPKGDDTFKLPHITFSFARRSRLRIEVYISEGDAGRNKAIFDKLHSQKSEIEMEFGADLSWERLTGRQSARIAYYRENASITDSTEDLERLQSWAVETLPRFHNALSEKFIAAQKETIE